jgi:hypothetical protein
VKVKSNRWYKNLLFGWFSIGLIALSANISPAKSQIILIDLSINQSSTTLINTDDSIDSSLINTDDLIDSSCIGRRNQEETDSFIITGNDSLPTTPSLMNDSSYPTGSVQTIPITNVDGDNRPRKKCEPIIEPTGIYKLSNGELVMNRECSR